MSKIFGLIVTDTSPLFKLVLADSLDALLRPGIPISIPDAVYIEATRVRGAPGAERLIQPRRVAASFSMASGART
jgi:hypothetical protein